MAPSRGETKKHLLVGTPTTDYHRVSTGGIRVHGIPCLWMDGILDRFGALFQLRHGNSLDK
eukprot:scaffold570429_cov122-Attheya_sp.AAC.1